MNQPPPRIDDFAAGLEKFHDADCPHRNDVLVGNCCQTNDVALNAVQWKAKCDVLSAAQERAYQALELCGVPRERAKSVANGIQVFMTRTDRERRAFEETIRRLEAEVKALKEGR